MLIAQVLSYYTNDNARFALVAYQGTHQLQGTSPHVSGRYTASRLSIYSP